uniref:Uncharacterized protein n=1 Tax=Cacopsylla melanoneura TaxID=428564 RepID=A0A8D9DZS6_9HEMI
MNLEFFKSEDFEPFFLAFITFMEYIAAFKGGCHIFHFSLHCQDSNNFSFVLFGHKRHQYLNAPLIIFRDSPLYEENYLSFICIPQHNWSFSAIHTNLMLTL